MGLEDDKEYITLFEFKCPHSRIPTEEIPEHYRPQITVGMNIIDIAEVGVFIQAVYRRCNFLDIAYNAIHNGSGHFKRPSGEGNPLETGFMVLYSDDPEFVDELIDQIEQTTGVIDINGIIDLGSVSDPDAFESVLGACVSKKVSVDYSNRFTYCQRVFDKPLYELAPYDCGLRQRAACALDDVSKKYGGRLIGVLPYKLLNVHTTPVRKQHDFIQSSGALVKAEAVVKCLNEIRDLGITDKKVAASLIRKYKL